MIPNFVRFLKLNVLIAFALLLCGSIAFARPASRYAPPRRGVPNIDNAQFEALPLDRSSQNHLIVRAFINGKPALLGVDTGAPVSAIAASRRAYYGLTPIPGTSKLPPRLMINGAFSAVGIAKSLRLGALNLIDEPMVAINLGSSSRAARIRGEQEIDGILGADILFPTRAVVDCKRQLLILNMEPESEVAAPGVDYRGYHSVPIHVTEGYNLYVDGMINGTPAQLMVDTGAFATLLHRPFVKRMKIPMRETPFTSAAVNLKHKGVQVARIRRLSVGTVNIIGHDVGVIDLEGLIHGGLLDGKRPVAGLLGGELLQRHQGIIDFGTRRLYLKG
jgi:predicted aspartyl protease